MQHSESSENCCILGIRHAVSSKAQGTVKVRKFKKVRNFNSTRILICNPGLPGEDEHDGYEGRRGGRAPPLAAAPGRLRHR